MKTVKYKSEHDQIYVMGDTHLDHPNTDLKLLQSHIDLIKNSGSPWMHLGDWVDAITPKDSRFDIKDKRAGVIESYLHMENLFKPIAHQCIAMLRGNHGSKWSRQEGDMIRVIAGSWDVPYLGYCGFIRFNGKTIFLHHGAGGGRKRGAKTIRLNEWAQSFDADIYLQGHTHTYVAFPDEVITYRGVRTRWFGNVPGYIRSYRGHDNYVEELGLSPQVAGMLRLEMEPIKILPVIE